MAAAAIRASSTGLFLGVMVLLALAVLAGVGLAVGEMDAMVVSLTLVAAAATLIDYRIGALMLMVMVPLESNIFFPGNMFGLTGANPVNLLLVATLGSYVMRGKLQGFVPRPLLWLYVVPIVIAGLVGARHAEDVFPFFFETEVIHFLDAFGYLRDVMVKPLLLAVIALLIAQAVRIAQRPESFIGPIVISVWAMSLISIGFVIASGVNLSLLATTAARGFFSPMGMHANDLGRLYAVAYALLLFTWWETNDKALKTTLLLTMGVIVVALALTFSRGAFVGFLLINALFLMWKFNARTLAVGGGALVAAALVLPGFIISRVTLGFESGDLNEVSAGRIDGIWLPLLPELAKSPVWGNGLGSTMWSDAMWAESMLTVTHPHSAYFEALLDMGILGLGLLLAYFWHVWRNLRHLGGNPYLSPTMRGFFQGAAAGLLCFLVTGLVGGSLRPTVEFSFLWLAIGMMYGVLARKPAG